MARRIGPRIAVFATLFLLASCGANIRDYAGQTPPLDLRDFFNGPIEAWGMVQKRNGTVTRRFHVSMTATWRGEVGTLDEQFTYADGETQRRVWTITRIGEHRYEGTAGDIVGTAVGEARGNALNWRYTMQLPVGDDTYEVSFDDWMFLIDERHLINRADIRKFGVTVAEVTLFMQRQPKKGR